MTLSMQEFFYPGISSGFATDEEEKEKEKAFDAIISGLKPHFYSPIQHTVPVLPTEVLMRNSVPQLKEKRPVVALPVPQMVGDVLPQKRSKMSSSLKGGVPPGCDSLFWTIYQQMCLIEPDKYTTFGKQPLMAQTEEKSRIIAWIQENPKRFQTALVEHRIIKSRVQEILTQLLTGVANSLDCLMAYVAYYGVSVVAWYPQNRTYCNFTPLAKMEDEGERGDIVVEYCGRRWKLCERNDVKGIKEGGIKLKHYAGEGGSALGSESLYKKEELVKMGRILKIEVDGMGKKELYEKINICCYII